ncbi:MAG: hypothetical protein Q9O62_10130 [Ardenticatenia bacterium]|nr:hypothetical protein [Ardenticatenia bacterium]
MPVPDVNLTPSSRRPPASSHRLRPERLAWLLFAAGWVVLALMVVLRAQNQRSLREMELLVAQAQQEARQAERLLGRREERVETIAQLVRRANRLEAERAELQRRSFSLSELLLAIEEAAPPRLTVQSVHVSAGRVTVAGVAGSAALVVEFAQTLEAQLTSFRVEVERVEDRNDPTLPAAVEFVVILEQ